MVAENITGDIVEFFLPKDFGDGCLGCFTCVNKGREFCPHNSKIEPILQSMLSSDIIIIGSPTYVLEMTGHLKHFFDHIFTAWLSHRPEPPMFTKTAVVVSTAAGSGMGGVTKSLARQLFYLGVPKVYRLPARVAAMSWDDAKGKDRISAKAGSIAGKIIRKNGAAKPGAKLRFMFNIMRQMHKNNDWTPLDKEHWQEKGWLGRTRPWISQLIHSLNFQKA
jgi:multimeric flavodoxin WrbA